jgi:hypothetical protein
MLERAKNMRKIKLTKREKDIESALLKGEYLDINKDEFRHVAKAIASRKKDSVLNIRENPGPAPEKGKQMKNGMQLNN